MNAQKMFETRKNLINDLDLVLFKNEIFDIILVMDWCD